MMPPQKETWFVCFLDDSKSWQLEKNRPEFHHGWPSKFQPPKKESLLYRKRTLLNPKKCRFRVDDFPFLSGQPAGRFVVRPGIWIRLYDSSSPWLWGAAGPKFALPEANSEFTPQKLAQIAPKPGNQLSFNHWFSGVNLLSVSGRVRDS